MISKRSPYQNTVCEYLASAWGKSTPNHVAVTLLALRPESVGMRPRPSLAAIHATRSYLEVTMSEEKTAC